MSSRACPSGVGLACSILIACVGSFFLACACQAIPLSSMHAHLSVRPPARCLFFLLLVPVWHQPLIHRCRSICACMCAGALLAQTIEELRRLAEQDGQPAYRGKQLQDGLLRGARTLDDFTNVSNFFHHVGRSPLLLPDRHSHAACPALAPIGSPYGDINCLSFHSQCEMLPGPAVMAQT